MSTTSTSFQRLDPSLNEQNPSYAGIELPEWENISHSLPQFIIIGTWKGGTTSLKTYLGKYHPYVCMQPLEINYWSRTTAQNGLKWYQEQYFSHCKNTMFVGEKSASYLYHWNETIPMLKRYLPNVKLIGLLRHPVNRAYSNWYMDWCKRAHNGTFEQWLFSKTKMIDIGRYDVQVEMYNAAFPPEQMLWVRSEDMFENPTKILEEIQVFLGLPVKTFTPEELVVYGSSPTCQHSFGLKSPIIQNVLLELYAPSIRNLERILQRSMNWN